MRWPAQKHTDRTTDSRHTGKAVREIHADATGGRGHARRSARGHKVRPVARQCDAGTQSDAETIRLLQSIHSGVMCCVGGMAISERADESAYIRCINLIIARVNPTPHSRIAGCLQSAPLLVPLSTSRSCAPYATVQRRTRLRSRALKPFHHTQRCDNYFAEAGRASVAVAA